MISYATFALLLQAARVSAGWMTIRSPVETAGSRAVGEFDGEPVPSRLRRDTRHKEKNETYYPEMSQRAPHDGRPGECQAGDGRDRESSDPSNSRKFTLDQTNR